MRILIINTTAHTGGASIAAGRLMNALVANGHEVKLLVRDDQKHINRLRFVWERLELFYLNGFDYKHVFAIDHGGCGTDITSLPEFEWADVIHLHWINQAMMGLKDLERLLTRCKETGKRVAWTMHDLWPASSICHLTGDCTKWMTGCGDCPQLRKNALTTILPCCGRGKKDLSARIFRKKAQIYAIDKIRFVACSQYLSESAQKAPLLKGHTVTSIANPLDTEFFSPVETIEQRNELRRQLELPLKKRLILFVAFNINDNNKGFRFVEAAVSRLIQRNPDLRQKIAVVPVGKNASQYIDRFTCEVCPFEYVGEIEKMRNIYRASDLLVISSMMENLPNTIVEAKACGLPVVATEVGGIPQMIRHKIDGYLAHPQDSDDIAEGLQFVINHPEPSTLSAAARADAVDTYSEASVAKRYLELYNS